MKVEKVKYADVELVFRIYTGKVQGYNKFLKSDTFIKGGGGKISTGTFSGKVSGNISPVTSSTTHIYISEFAVVEDEGTEFSLRLTNLPLLLRNDLSIAVWVEDKTNKIYQIINANSGEYAVINDLGKIFKETNYYFDAYIRRNTFSKYIWWSTLLICIIYSAWLLIDVFTGTFELSTIIIAIIFLLPPYFLRKVVKRVFQWQIVRGFYDQFSKVKR